MPKLIDVSDGQRDCTGCKERKPLAAFARAASAKTGVRSSCRECANATRRSTYPNANAQLRERRRTDVAFREARAAAQRKYLYGVDASEWDAMFQRQGRVCAACGADSPGQSYDWATDHDHRCCPGRRSCGKCIRGILCTPCNKGLGLFADDVDRLMMAAAYLLQSQNLLTEGALCQSS